MHKEVLKGTRWLLLKNPENLDAEKDEKQRLEGGAGAEQATGDGLLYEGRPAAILAATWEAVRDDVPGRVDSPSGASGIKILQQMAKTLAAHRSGLLAYYDVMIQQRPDGGDKQQDQDDEAPGVRVPGHGVLQTQDPCDP